MIGKITIARTVVAVVLCVSAFVVLGISVHIERSIRTVGLKTSTYVFDAVVAGFTVLLEPVGAYIRLQRDAKPNRLAVEVGLLSFLWLMWLAAGISTTVITEEGRGFCKNIDDLALDPDLASLDPAILATLKTILNSVCTELHAELAFLWIGWTLVTLSLMSILALGLAKQRKLGKSVWTKSLRELERNGFPGGDQLHDLAGDVPGLSNNRTTTRDTEASGVDFK